MTIVEFRGGDLRKHLSRKTKDELVHKYMTLLRLYESATPGHQIMEAELAVDVYEGPNCDQHRPYWKGWGEGDKCSPSELPDPLQMLSSTFRPGTRVFVYEPVCPRCTQIRELCEGDEGCDFDWRQRDEEHYS